VEAKYGSLWGGWCSDVGRGPYVVSLWKFIRRGWDSFSPLLSFKVGDGSSVRLWHDVWCGDSPLKRVYPGLFLIFEDRDASVAVLMSFRHNSLHWELNFLRNIQDWELDSMTSFLEVVYSATVEGNGADNLC
jgi:hypothetical protein